MPRLLRRKDCNDFQDTAEKDAASVSTEAVGKIGSEVSGREVSGASIAEKGTSGVAVTARAGAGNAVEDKNPTGTSTTEKATDGVETEGKAESGVSAAAVDEGENVGYAENEDSTAPDLSAPAVRDWRDVHRSCDVLSLDDIRDYILAIPVEQDAVAVGEGLEKSAVIVFGDNADPEDNVGLTGDSVIGALIAFLEGIALSDDSAIVAKPWESDAVGLSQDSVIVAKDVASDSVSVADGFDWTLILAFVDGPYFLYGQGGYGRSGYGGSLFLPLADELNYKNALNAKDDNVGLTEDEEAYALPVIPTMDIVVL